MRPKIFVTGQIPDSAKTRLSAACDMRIHDGIEAIPDDELVSHIKDCDGVVCLLGDKINAQVMDACQALKVVANVAVGYDNVQVDEATKRGILVNNTPGVLDNATADVAFALLLDLARRISESDRFVRAGKWEGWKLDLMLGADLHGKTLGILGMGRIGQAVARRAVGFGMNIIYCRGGEVDEKDRKLEREFGARRVSMDDLLKESDFVSVHVPLSPKTRHIVGKRELSLMKRSARIVNTSRGPIIDESALIEALEEGRIAGAGLDVFEREPSVPDRLKALDNVVLTPHIGSATDETRTAMAELAIKGLVTAFSGTLPDNCVNKDAWPAFKQRLHAAIDV